MIDNNHPEQEHKILVKEYPFYIGRTIRPLFYNILKESKLYYYCNLINVKVNESGTGTIFHRYIGNNKYKSAKEVMRYSIDTNDIYTDQSDNIDWQYKIKKSHYMFRLIAPNERFIWYSHKINKKYDLLTDHDNLYRYHNHKWKRLNDEDMNNCYIIPPVNSNRTNVPYESNSDLPYGRPENNNKRPIIIVISEHKIDVNIDNDYDSDQIDYESF